MAERSASHSASSPEKSQSVRGGSSDYAAAVAARGALEKGATCLEAKIAAHVASFGEQCWQTDRALAEVLRRPDGTRYHRESIGRARRHMARVGWLISLRLQVGAPLPAQARFARTSHGTTVKSIRWHALEVRRPTSRGERRARRAERARMAPRYVTFPTEPEPVDRMPLAEVLELAQRAMDRVSSSSSSASSSKDFECGASLEPSSGPDPPD